MSVVEPGSSSANLIARVKGMLLRPAGTWDEIDVEPATVGGVYKGYVIPLAAASAICGLVGMVVFGVGALGFSYRPPLVPTAIQYAVGFLFNLAGVYVLALLIDWLAPKFEGTSNRLQAFKLAAYSGTAAWVAGVFTVIPMLGVLVIVGAIYGLYTLYKGLPKLMKNPAEKTTPYFVLIIVVGIVVGVVFAAISGWLGMGRFGGPMGMARQEAATVTVPGLGTVDVANLEAQAKKAEAMAKQMESGQGVAASDPEALKAMLPASVAGYARTEMSSGSGGAGGFQASSAEARYAKGDASIELSINDIGAAGALAGMVGSLNVKSSEEKGDRYEKMGKVGGRMTQESYDRSSRHGEYGVMVGDRFMVSAEGNNVSIDELKAAVQAVNFATLETMAKAAQ